MDPNSRMDDVVWDGGSSGGDSDEDGCLMVAVAPVIALILAVIAFVF